MQLIQESFHPKRGVVEILTPIFQSINYISLFCIYGFIKFEFRKQESWVLV